jgi:general secretion pathway protein J
MTHRDRGFTLVEVLLALSIGAALLVIMFGGVRAGLAAWSRGEARAIALEHGRSLEQLLGQAVRGMYPYRGTLIKDTAVGIIFDGQPDRLTFVTVSPPIAAPIPIAFSAVTVSRDDQGLSMRQLVLPNFERIDRLAPILVDSSVIGVRFRYLGEDEAWKDRWDVSKEDSLPRAVEIQLVTADGNRRAEQPPFVVPVRVLTP